MFVRGTTVFRALVLSPGETPTFSAHLYLARSPHLRRPQGFWNLPMSRPGLGKLPTPTRQSVSSLWSPECLLPNSQIGRVSPYSYEASPPLSGLILIFQCHHWILHPEKHGFRNQNLVSIYPRCRVISENVISLRWRPF